MNITLDCLSCFVKHGVEVAKIFCGDDDTREKIVKNIISRIADMDFNQSPPQFAAEIHDYIRKELKNDDPYYTIKKNANKLALQLTDKLRERLVKESSPLELAIRYSIAGNIIDSGVSAVTEIDDILHSIKMAESEALGLDYMKELIAEIEGNEEILILGDNAGEIYFDKLLMELLKNKKITYAVKSGPILNDSLKDDAIESGIDNLATIIENGTNIPGTSLPDTSLEFREVFEKSPLVISKGQANFETLSNCKHPNLFFLLRAKCSVVASMAKVKLGSFIVGKYEG